jgi:glycosyltransferase involved in cell wall biosynthesis
MRILQLCHKPPLPAKDGGCLAMHQVSTGLMQAGHDLKILSIFTQKHPFELEQMTEEYVSSTDIEGVYIDTSINLVDAYSSLITQDSYNITRFFSTDMDSKLTKTLQQNHYDLIILESLFMSPYIGTIRRFSNARIILRSHNLEYIIWERMAETSGNIARKAYLRYLARKLKETELDAMRSVDGIVAISSEDAKRFKELGLKKPLIAVPFGVDLSTFDIHPYTKNEGLNLFHIGAMDWSPNVEGIYWFLEEIWPEVLQTTPNAKLHLAGRNMSDTLQQSDYPNTHIYGEIKDAYSFMGAYDVMVVPLLAGGGMRVKIIEAMALGKTVISTSIGAEGIIYENGKDIIIADNALQFVQAIKKLYLQPELITTIGKAARKNIEENYDSKKLISNILSFYQSIDKK